MTTAYPVSLNFQEYNPHMSLLDYWKPVVRCKSPSCLFGKPTFLPYPNLLEITQDQPKWPTDAWKPFLICKHCGHGYVYSKKDVEWASSQNKSGLPEHNSVLYIELRCAQKDCKLPVKLYLCFDDSKKEKHRDRMLEQGTDNAICEAGHAPAEPLRVIQSTSVNMIS